ncbi:vomeronasal type-1 receptor 4-like [Choloepus didactylus]|uniref:vomeronasal type-1 receptor 4-like n=1 Tax=Choloepus didactylus TaxID=27675 RepID=UPI00189F5D77|nr:vomeronasal type-1 receptor 4-like [Choloepus didactylus]
MSSRNLVIGMVFLSQTVAGVFGNLSVLYHYLFLYCSGGRLRSTDLIINHLLVANSLVLFSNGVPWTMVAFGWEQFLSDYGCKLLYYIYRVGRGVCIGSTCLLSIFQVIIISPRNSMWAELKVKAPRNISLSISLCWHLIMLVNIIIPIDLTRHWRNDTIKMGKDLGFCSAKVADKITYPLYAALLSFPDALCLGLMLWASGSMVSILYRHKQRVQHIHRTSLSPRSSPDARATQTILLLLSTLVSFYTLSCIFQVCINVYDHPNIYVVNMAALFSVCFPTVSPFLLMGWVSIVFKLCFTRFHNGDVSFWGHLTGGTWYQFVSSGLLLTSLTYSALCQISPLETSYVSPRDY